MVHTADRTRIERLNRVRGCLADGRSGGSYRSRDRIKCGGHLRLGTRTYFSRYGDTMVDDDDDDDDDALSFAEGQRCRMKTTHFFHPQSQSHTLYVLCMTT